MKYFHPMLQLLGVLDISGNDIKCYIMHFLCAYCSTYCKTYKV